MIHVDGAQQVSTNQPTYVLLQAPGDSESGLFWFKYIILISFLFVLFYCSYSFDF